MFKIGDLVQHKTTGKLGTIVGYGCRVLDRTYFLTLKVNTRAFPSVLKRRGVARQTSQRILF